jgi:hypothetical protein
MNTSDWIGGASLAGLFSILGGMIGSLYVSILGKPEKYVPDAPLVSSRDVRHMIIIAAILWVVSTPMLAMLFKADRQDAESWQTYTREHKCVVTDSRTHTSMSGGYPGTLHTTTTTEYLWRCEGGDEHWHP